MRDWCFTPAFLDRFLDFFPAPWSTDWPTPAITWSRTPTKRSSRYSKIFFRSGMGSQWLRDSAFASARIPVLLRRPFHHLRLRRPARPLHGHDFAVGAEVAGPLDENHYVVDFVALEENPRRARGRTGPPCCCPRGTSRSGWKSAIRRSRRHFQRRVGCSRAGVRSASTGQHDGGTVGRGTLPKVFAIGWSHCRARGSWKSRWRSGSRPAARRSAGCS